MVYNNNVGGVFRESKKMNGFLISVVSVLYLGFLFYLAFVAERFKSKKKSLIDNPYVYALSLSVYCTAWTFYGSVGRVKQTGLEFLSVYIGPTLVMLRGWSILRLCRQLR